MSVTIDKMSHKATVSVPCFGVNDIDRRGYISIWSLQNLFRAGRSLAFYQPNTSDGRTLLEFDKLTHNYLIFIASIKTEVAKEFYKLIKVGKVPNVSINVHLGYIGTSSLTTVAVLEDLDTGTTLGKNTNQMVTVDRKTRRPVPLAEWWREKYASAIVGNEPLQIKPIAIPEGTHKYDIKVRWGDTDIYRHTNYLSYVKLCMDAGMQGVTDNAYIKITDDFSKYHVNKMELCYRGESRAGEVLTISSWEADADSCALNFDISKAQSPLFQSKFHFFTPEDV